MPGVFSILSIAAFALCLILHVLHFIFRRARAPLGYVNVCLHVGLLIFLILAAVPLAHAVCVYLLSTLVYFALEYIKYKGGAV